MAVGYFTDKSLARTSDGEADPAFSGLSWTKYPAINIYPKPKDVNSDKFKPTFYTVRWGEDATFLDVAVLQNSVESKLEIEATKWGIDGYSADYDFFFAALAIQDDSPSTPSERLFIFKASRNYNEIDQTYNEWHLSLHAQFENP